MKKKKKKRKRRRLHILSHILLFLCGGGCGRGRVRFNSITKINVFGFNSLFAYMMKLTRSCYFSS